MSLRLSSMIVLLLVACAGLHCSQPKSKEDLVGRAEYLCLEARFDEAIPVLKNHLLSHPDDAGAHFLLGRSYLFAEKPWLMIAQGELETARTLFLKGGKKSPLSRYSDTYFESICHLEIAKVYLRQIQVLMTRRGQTREIEKRVNLIAECNELARKLEPNSPDVKMLDEALVKLRRIVEEENSKALPASA